MLHRLKSSAGRLYSAVVDPGSFARFGSLSTRRFYSQTQKIIQRTSIRHRRALLDALPPSPFGSIDRDKGFHLAEGQKDHPLVAAALAETEAIKDSTDLEQAKKRKDYLIQLIPRGRVSRDMALYKLATSPEIIRTVGDYLGMVPVLTYINIWFSPNKQSNSLAGSQFFHLDHEDFTQIKCFLYANDVDLYTGPMLGVRADTSEKIQQKIGYRMDQANKRLADDTFSEEPIVQMTGKTGTLAFVDTGRCFHAGSRSGNRSRLLATFQYLTPLAFVRKAYKNRILTYLEQPGISEIEKCLLRF